MERLFEALEESRNSRGNKGGGDRNRKRDLKVGKRASSSDLIFILRYKANYGDNLLLAIDYSDHLCTN